MQRPLFGREHNYIFGFLCLCVCVRIFLSFRLLQIPGAVAGSLPTAERLRRSSKRTRTEDGAGDYETDSERQCRAGQGGACRAAAAIVTCMFCVLLSGIIVTTTSASLFDHCPGHSKETLCDMWAETEQIVLGPPKSSSLSKAIKLPYCFVGVQSGLVTCG